MYYLCEDCGFKHNVDGMLARCPYCGGNLTIYNEFPEFSVENLPGIWRYRRYFPKLFKNIFSLGEGRTPLIRSFRLKSYFKLKNLFIKDETRNPTGSFIDRGTSILISIAESFGVKRFYCEARGNLAASISAYSNLIKVKTYTRLIEPIDRGKLYQILLYGGEIVSDVVAKPFYPVFPTDPFLVEGYKTISYELIEDHIGRIDAIIVPMGSGSLLFSIWKGFKELVEMNVIDNLPRIYGVQESVCAPIVRSFHGKRISKGHRGIAIEINDPNPGRMKEAINAVKDTNGDMVEVNSMQIIEGIKLLARFEGILVEPAGAASIAALKILLDRGEIDFDENIVVMATGAGLKGPKTLLKILSGYKGFRRNSMKINILKILADKSMHPYSVWKKLSEKGFTISKTAIYQHLNDLERLGYVSSKFSDGRKIFYLTSKGLSLIKSTK